MKILFYHRKHRDTEGPPSLCVESVFSVVKKCINLWVIRSGHGKFWRFGSLTLIAIFFCFSADLTASPLDFLNSQPSSIVHGVDVMTGEYGEASTDLKLPGPELSALQRYYMTSIKGWRFSDPIDFESQQAISESIQRYPSGEEVMRSVEVLENGKKEVTYCTQDAKLLSYLFLTQPISQYAPLHYLEKVIFSDGTAEEYVYIDHPTENRKLLDHKIDREGSRLEITYITTSDRKNHTKPAKVSTLSFTHASDPSRNFHLTFEYQPGKTVVHDFHDNLISYIFSPHHRLISISTAIPTSEGMHQTYRTLRYFWNPKNGQLISIAIEDGEEKTLACKTIKYDDSDNPIKTTLYGNLTGKCQVPLILRASGLPIKNGIESWSTDYLYDSEKLLQISSKNQKSTHFIYDESLLKAELFFENNAIVKRNFYSYDDHKFLNQIIRDNGSASECSDLQDVSWRKILEFKKNFSPLHWGEIEAFEQKLLDPKTGKEELIVQEPTEEKVDHKYQTVQDSLGRITEVTLPCILDLEDRWYLPSISYAYDIFDKPIHIIDANGYVTKKFYNTYGEITHIDYPDGTQKEFFYHKDGTPIEQLSSSGLPQQHNQDSTESHKMIDEYGHEVLQKKYFSPEGIQTIITCDLMDRPSKIIIQNSEDEVIKSHTIRYDGNGNKIQETVTDDSHIYRVRWIHGPMNRLEAVIENPNTLHESITQYFYDDEGRLATEVKPDGTALFRLYDDKGNLSQLIASDGSFHYHYRYDEEGRAIYSEELLRNIVVWREYGEGRKIVREWIKDGPSIAFKFDDKKRLTKITLCDASQIAYHYTGDLLREIQRLSKGKEVLYSHIYSQYDEFGFPVKMSLVDQCDEIELKYTEDHQLRSIQNQWFSQQVTRDKKGNIAFLTTKDPLGTVETGFVYNALDQLIKEGNREYSYDLKEDNCEYDLKGNLVIKNTPQGTLYFHYDALNRLIEVHNNKIKISFAYDGFGRRVKSQELAFNSGFWEEISSKYYLFQGNIEIGSCDQEMIIHELKVLGNGYMNDIGATVAIELEGTRYVPLHDLQGSIRLLLDPESKSIVEWSRYSAYGEEQLFDSQNSPIINSRNPWHYVCKRKESLSGWLLFENRAYDPTIHQWTSKDPLGFTEGPNRYSYCCRNPLHWIDPLGLAPREVSWFDKMFERIDFFSDILTTLSCYISDFRKDYGFLPYIKYDLERVGHEVLGQTFFLMSGYYKHRAATGVFGEGEIHPLLRITSINGILNSRVDCAWSWKVLSRAHSNANIHYIFKPTEGWTWDVIKAALIKFGYVSRDAFALAAKWKVLIHDMGGVNNGGLIIHYAHSIGGADTYAAKSLMTPQELKMIRVITMGSPYLIPEGGFKSVSNYLSKRDGVPLLDPFHYFKGLIGEEKNIFFLGSYLGIPFIDHCLTSQTYVDLIRQLGKSLLDELMITDNDEEYRNTPVGER